MQDFIESVSTGNATLTITEKLKNILNETKAKLKGHSCRRFMAQIVSLLGVGGQSHAERELGWDRKTIRKGIRELETGIICLDNYSGRGRKRAEAHLPNLLSDIKEIVDPVCQTDPTFRTVKLYSPLTAKEVRRRLIEDNHYDENILPSERTISTKLNELNFNLKKVAKTKPKMKIKETDAIFENVHRINKLADESEGVIRLSMDAKATIKVGAFSRGGYSRQGVKAYDHDFNPEKLLKLFGIFLPNYDETHFFFTESNVTADFMIDALERIWPMIANRFDPHTIVINLDNGPENSSCRSQFIKRIVDFAQDKKIDVSLVYYPPYHSKYNPIERVWGVLENHWNGELFDSIEKVLGLAGTMEWKGKNPVLTMVEGIYETGVKLTKKVMEGYEKVIERMEKLGKWHVDIPCFEGG